MNGSHHVRGEGGFEKFAALFGDAKLWAEQRLGRSRTERHDHVRFDNRELGFEPGAAGSDLGGVGFLVNAAFAARFPFEVFDNIGDVSLFAFDACFPQRAIKQAAGRTDKRFSGEVFFVAGLFADKHYASAAAPFTKNGLRSFLPEIAGLATGGGSF